MQPRTLSYLDVVDQIRGLIEGNRDYVYPAQIGAGGNRSCRYWHEEESKPGCIVGIWGHSLGLAKHVLQHCENNGSIIVVERLEEAGFVFEDRTNVTRFMQGLQTAQDCGATWGYAYDNACDTMSLRQENEILKTNLIEARKAKTE
jgi:hypothetical protein